MNTDIRIAVSFRGHRKRRRLRMLLGPGSTDYLLDLWISTAQNHPKGRLEGMDEMDVALEAGWEGDPGKFAAALVECGFLDKDGDTFILHDWEEHQAYAARAPERKDAGRKAAKARWEATRSAGTCESHAQGNADSCESHAQGMPGAMRNCENRNAPLPDPLPDPEELITPTHTGKDTIATTVPESGGEGFAEPGMEFLVLREAYDQRGRKEAPLAGFQEYKRLRASRGWPGVGRIEQAIILLSEQDAQWKAGFAPGLAKFLKERGWLKEPARARASPRPPTGSPLEHNVGVGMEVLAERRRARGEHGR